MSLIGNRRAVVEVSPFQFFQIISQVFLVSLYDFTYIFNFQYSPVGIFLVVETIADYYYHT
jgi:hypothetical protein